MPRECMDIETGQRESVCVVCQSEREIERYFNPGKNITHPTVLEGEKDTWRKYPRFLVVRRTGTTVAHKWLT